MVFSAGRRSFLRGRIQSPPAPPGLTTAVIGAACLARVNVACRSCEEACDGAIRLLPQAAGAGLPEVLADRCNGCGACVAICPVQAVTVVRGESS